MKRMILVFAVFALALPALAQEGTDFKEGEVSLEVARRDSDTLSSKFLEYRDIPQGGQAPFLRLRGKKGDFWYDVVAIDTAQKDQQYLLRLQNDSIKVKGNYVGIPHNFGNGGKSLLGPASNTEYRMSDTLQSSFQTGVTLLSGPARTYANIRSIVSPSLDGSPADIDLKLTRDRSALSLAYAPKGASYSLGVTYLHERRSGTRAANGTSFGFGNVVETPEPVRYITQDVGVEGSVSGGWGIARAAFHFNDFKDGFPTFGWDNPFRATDSTDPSAYTAPGAGSVNGPKTGLSALPPDNKAVTGSAGASFKFGANTRLNADVSFGQWRQNEAPFISYTTNTAIRLPDGQLAVTAALPASHLDGKINTTSLSAYFTTRVADHLRLNARYRRFDAANKTPRLRFEEGYVRFDAVWEEIPRISVPYGYTNDYFDATFSYDLGKASVEGGYKYARFDRTFRETEKTNEHGVRFAVDVRGTDWVTLRGLYEFGRRDFAGAYDTVASEFASHIEPEEVPDNQPTLRRYDQAKRDLQRFGGTLQIAPPNGKATILFQYTKTKQDYDKDPVPREIQPGSEPPLGLQNSDYESITIEGDFAPTARATFYAFYNRENIDDFQTGRQSGATVEFSPNFAWSSTVADRVDSVGGGADFVLQPEKWTLKLFGRWQKANGNNAFTAGSSLRAADIPTFDDTELAHISAALKYQVAKAWAIGFGGLFEDYTIKDSQTDGILNYMPGSFFLATNLGNYQAWVGWISLKYSWQ